MLENFEQNMLKNYYGLAPVNVRGKNNLNNLYQKRYLLNKLYSKFKFTLPEDFELNAFRFILLYGGTIGIFKKDDPFFAHWFTEEWSIYYQPYKVASQVIAGDINLVNKYNLKNQIVDKDCVLIKCFDDFHGFADIINDYAETLSSYDKTIKVALMNARVNLAAFAKDKKQAEEIRTGYAAATEGEPLIIFDKDLEPEDREKLLVPLTNHDTTGMLDKLLTTRRAVVNNFLTEIGIENANINKKERLNTDEVNANNEEVVAIINVVYENIKKGFDKANELFGLNMSVELVEAEEEDETLPFEEEVESYV